MLVTPINAIVVIDNFTNAKVVTDYQFSNSLLAFDCYF